MTHQDKLRQDCKAYITKHGSRHKHICNIMDVSQTTVSLWLKGERDIAEHRLERLREAIGQ